MRLLNPLPDRFALAGIAVLAIAWSLGVMAARWPEVEASGVPLHEAVVLIVAGGAASVLSLWFGISSVMWAMCRVCSSRIGGNRIGLASMLGRLSASALLLVPGALALAAMSGAGRTAGSIVPWFVVVISAAAFCIQIVAVLREAYDGSLARASGCVALTAIFCASFVSLYQ